MARTVGATKALREVQTVGMRRGGGRQVGLRGSLTGSAAEAVGPTYQICIEIPLRSNKTVPTMIIACGVGVSSVGTGRHLDRNGQEPSLGTNMTASAISYKRIKQTVVVH